MLMVYCMSKEQAEKNVEAFINAVTYKHDIVKFASINNLNNATLLSEIISVSVGDGELCKSIRIEDVEIHEDICNSYENDKDGPEYPTAYNTDEEE
jgi:hypothetical protein